MHMPSKARAFGLLAIGVAHFPDLVACNDQVQPAGVNDERAVQVHVCKERVTEHLSEEHENLNCAEVLHVLCPSGLYYVIAMLITCMFF